MEGLRAVSHNPGVDSLAVARRVLEIEGEAIRALIPRLGDAFVRAVELLRDCRGRVVLSGMGKSGFIAKKIAATFASTGTPALFLHPAEGVHGDLGMVVRGDVVVAISNSGETEELLQLLPAFKRLDVRLIALAGNSESTLARRSDVVLDVGVAMEACPLNLAPTASTTAALAMGDALAVALLECRGIREEDFALIHPGGTLGRKLLLTVADLMHRGDELPLVNQGVLMREAIPIISGKRLGMAAVTDADGTLVGIITDGDLRRALLRWPDLLDRPVHGVMTCTPKRIAKGELAARAVQLMEQHAITSLLIVDGSGRPEGVLHLHDLLRAGVV
ncbi:MAG TPA: KpsF/GutQ family sugar-phosphate isomerase [Candidatus Acidoferrum sp.]|nr:KpsF/GutQ family sugar-phosphate isomerase [Candidatus Acidoferrum sp.]